MILKKVKFQSQQIYDADDHKARAAAADDGFIYDPSFNGYDPKVDVEKIEKESKDFELPDLRGKFIREKKCECGAAVTHGYTQPGPGHASWCPIATK